MEDGLWRGGGVNARGLDGDDRVPAVLQEVRGVVRHDTSLGKGRRVETVVSSNASQEEESLCLIDTQGLWMGSYGVCYWCED